MQCAIEIPADSKGVDTYQCHRDAVRRCDDCGCSLCKVHSFYLEEHDQYFCDSCASFIQDRAVCQA